MKYYNLFKTLFEKTQLKFILTSTALIPYLISFLFPIKIPNIINNNFFPLNEIKILVKNILHKEPKMDVIRNQLNKLLLNVENQSEIYLNIIDELYKFKPKKINKIINYAAESQYLSMSGNKDILYLEYFILLIINNVK